MNIKGRVGRYKELITGSKAKQLAKELANINNKLDINEAEFDKLQGKYRDSFRDKSLSSWLDGSFEDKLQDIKDKNK